jgi:hypothetical protein
MRNQNNLISREIDFTIFEYEIISIFIKTEASIALNVFFDCLYL